MIPNALDKIDEIRGVTFTRHNGQKSAGIIAQELEKVLPEAVREKKLALHDGKEYIRLIDNDYNDEVEELNEDSYHYPDNGNGHITNENENFININNLNLEELKESISNNQSEITNTNNIIQMIEKNSTENMVRVSVDRMIFSLSQYISPCLRYFNMVICIKINT